MVSFCVGVYVGGVIAFLFNMVDMCRFIRYPYVEVMRVLMSIAIWPISVVGCIACSVASAVLRVFRYCRRRP